MGDCRDLEQLEEYISDLEYIILKEVFGDGSTGYKLPYADRWIQKEDLLRGKWMFEKELQ